MTQNCQNCGVTLAGNTETCPFCSFEVTLNLSAARTSTKIRAFLAVIRLGLLAMVLGLGLVIVWDVLRISIQRDTEDHVAQPTTNSVLSKGAQGLAKGPPVSVANLFYLRRYAEARQALQEKIRQRPDELEEWRFQWVAALLLEEFSKGHDMLHPGPDFQSALDSLYKDYPDGERTRALEELLAHLWSRPGGYIDLRHSARRRSAFVRWCGDEISMFDSMFASSRRSLRTMDYRSLSQIVPR